MPAAGDAHRGPSGETAVKMADAANYLWAVVDPAGGFTVVWPNETQRAQEIAGWPQLSTGA